MSKPTARESELIQLIAECTPEMEARVADLWHMWPNREETIIHTRNVNLLRRMRKAIE